MVVSDLKHFVFYFSWKNSSINFKRSNLRRCIHTTLLTRSQQSDSLRDLSVYMKEKCFNIIAMVGAGISTPSGIPDFRSPETGLYHNLQKYNLPYPEAIFDLHYFAANPKPFYELAKEIYPGVKYRPNLGHYFVRLLHEKGKLLRMYTQNIDGLERLTGIPEEKLVEAHGSFSSASCIVCYKKHDPDATKAKILKGDVVECQINGCKGLVKPDIVFFGEQLPQKFWLHEVDTDMTDLLIVIGTSLEVYPFAAVADAVVSAPRLLINREAVGSFGCRSGDVILKGDIIESVCSLAETLGWKSDLENMFKKNESKF